MNNYLILVTFYCFYAYFLLFNEINHFFSLSLSFLFLAYTFLSLFLSFLLLPRKEEVVFVKVCVRKLAYISVSQMNF